MDLTGAFGFIADDYYNLAIAMVFGSTMSASSWDPFQQAIETVSEVHANQPNLVSKHEKYLDMIGWTELDPNTPITPALACDINTGIVAADGTKKNLSAQIYVDDALLLGHSKGQIVMKLAALMEAIFVVMGEPGTTVRRLGSAPWLWINGEKWSSDQSRQCLVWLLIHTSLQLASRATT